MSKLPIVIACLLLALLAAPRAHAQTLQMADGQVLLAAIEDVDGQGLRVRRLDNGGTLDLRWDHLSAECAQRIKVAHDLAGGAEEETTVQADVISYVQFGSPTEMFGRIVDRTATHVVIQNKGVQYQIPKTEVRLIRQLDVPVSQIFTKDEYYTQRLTELQPGESADKHVLLAQEMIKVRDYDHAEDHLRQAEALGNSKAPAQVAALLERLKRYKEAQKERELLDQIQVARHRGGIGDFDKGRKLIADYESQYPQGQGKLRAEFDSEKKRFEEARTRFLSVKVADAYRRHILTVADRKAGEPGVTLAAVKEFAGSKMQEEITAKAAAQLSLTPEETRLMWQNRGKYPAGKRTDLFVYGIGSWVLGDSAILKDTKQGKAGEQAPKDPAQEREIERIAKAIRAAMERRAKNEGGQNQEATDEDWWRLASRNEKANWLRAFYAENSGDLVVTAAFVAGCVSCGGEGTLPEVQNGKVVRNKCFLCHGTKFLRSFYAY